jgi:tRNA A37 threonylcarbamoyltransferase TsaD
MMMPTRILGIESSCDETAASIVANGRDILSTVVASQIDVHRKYGGVVPELASREHLRQIVPVVREAIAQAGMQLSDIDAVGVTYGPGLVGALLVGITYGKTLAQALGKPLVPVNHLEGHVHAVFLEAHKAGKTPRLPAVCLIVSGGHTVLYEVAPHKSSPQTLALVREFQDAVVHDLVDRTVSAAEQLFAESILVSGGVAANSQLRTVFEQRAKSTGVDVFFPSRALSTDNAAMIAAAAYSRLRAGEFGDATLNADPALKLA